MGRERISDHRPKPDFRPLARKLTPRGSAMGGERTSRFQLTSEALRAKADPPLGCGGMYFGPQVVSVKNLYLYDVRPDHI